MKQSEAQLSSSSLRLTRVHTDTHTSLSPIIIMSIPTKLSPLRTSRRRTITQTYAGGKESSFSDATEDRKHNNKRRRTETQRTTRSQQEQQPDTQENNRDHLRWVLEQRERYAVHLITLTQQAKIYKGELIRVQSKIKKELPSNRQSWTGDEFFATIIHLDEVMKSYKHWTSHTSISSSSSSPSTPQIPALLSFVLSPASSSSLEDRIEALERQNTQLLSILIEKRE